MRKKIVITLASLAIMAATGWNVKQSMDLQNTNEMSALTIANIEALASGEHNSWDQWLDQGLHPDEEEKERDCPSSSSPVVAVMSPMEQWELADPDLIVKRILREDMS
jgi:hypothetical protein